MQPNTNEGARRRLTSGDVMNDSDVYVSPFAPNVERTGPVGLTGDPAIAMGGGPVFSQMLPPPPNAAFDRRPWPAPDNAMVAPEMQPQMYRDLIEALLRNGI